MLPEIHLTLTVLKDTFAVCRFPADAPIPAWALNNLLVSITRTEDELSILAPENLIVKEGNPCEKEWKCLKIEGPLPFNQIGIMAGLAGPLARANISIFAISTYDTDYIFIKDKDLEATLGILSQEGHWIRRH